MRTSAPPRVAVIVLNYRTAEMTLRSVEAALVAMRDIDGEIIVVDNASGDGSGSILAAAIADRGWHPKVRLILSDKNGGFGAGNNIGIRAAWASDAPPDYFYVLNSDAFPSPDALSRLIEALEAEPNAGFAGSFIKGSDGVTHPSAFRFPSIASEFEGAIRTGPVTRILASSVVAMRQPETTQAVDWVTGASLLMRRDVLEAVGLFDEEFFLYFEETDLCYRVAQAGFLTLYVRESVVEHTGSVSTGMKIWKRVPKYWFHSRRYYFLKTHGRIYAGLATLAHLAGALLFRLRRLLQNRPRANPPYFLRDLLSVEFSPVPRRDTDLSARLKEVDS